MTVERRERLKASVMKREAPTVEQGLELIEALEWADKELAHEGIRKRFARIERDTAFDFIEAPGLTDEYEGEEDDDEDGGVVGAFMSATTVRDINAGGLP